ncbi:PIN domain-containing protein [Rubrobacter marinus]|uniref:PIN domain-containing protein n=1 Tax=Rubrobacter marinus TaxID=2653852 RepID=A0A6G8Q1I2_9ACTN|nr:type II toxin-antitoxin system VapC family toxin [Rubrobacter marinus]QIN80308.1 PIN domain-containing protein [Rubrobacter marinus]
MSFVLDMNVVSEARKGTRMNVGVARWFSAVEPEELYLSVLVVGEIRQGIEGLRGRDRMQADYLEAWLSGLRRRYLDRIIPIDEQIAEEWGRMSVPYPISSRDGLMAATARVKGMTFVTRNTRDVARTGARLLDPFDADR